MTNFLKKNWLLLLAELIVFIVFCAFYGRFGDIAVDSFREAYIPEQMLNGGILYKNIFCIYPPLGYLINELLSKIFGVNLNVLYFAGLFSTMCIFALVYNITRMFFDKLLSFGILFFLISACVLSPNVFNMFLPYSFGILYGLLFALGSIYSALNKKFPAAYLLCSLAISSKAEF